MATSFEIKVSGIEGTRAKLRDLRANLSKMVIDEINTAAVLLQTHIREECFRPYTGQTDPTTLQRRSGVLSKSVRPIPAKREGDSIRGGVSIGTKYAQVHFGKRGQTTTIVPKTKKFLAIPLPGAMNNHGVAKGNPRDSVFGETFIHSPEGSDQAIIFGKLAYVKGPKAGKTKGKIIPLFVLKRSVEIKSRIHPEDLEKWMQPVLGKALMNVKQFIESSSEATI